MSSATGLRRGLIGLALATTLGATTLAGTAGAATASPAAPHAAAPHAAAPYASAPAADTWSHAATRKALDGLVKAGMPGVAAEARTPTGSWFGSAGAADTATGRERTAQDHFRAGSITKTFMTVVLLQLEAEGKLDIDDSVESKLPGLLQGNGYDGNKISIRQLLNHTSGVADTVETPEWQQTMNGEGFLKNRYQTRTPEQLVAMATKYPPLFAPGTGWHYSNTNFNLAGMIIEKVTGNTYAKEAEQRVIKPLGLRETSFPGTRPTLPSPHPIGYSKLYVPDPGPTVHDATEYNPSWSGATGELISTSGDLNRFFGALLRGKLLPQRQMDQMLQTVETGQHYRYGLGIIQRTLSCGTQVWGHDGVVWGSLTGAASTRDGRHTLAFNINGDWLTEEAPFENVFKGEFCGA
ncbi:serine hydrolase domain-containing protein [Streptomyces sp. URMC 123]|uniref:serine hydrolase domain-containing protein n=1 Tax=Streptomyces sp. URMC 123 TaxID=3423403 RepID=UPI003F1ACEAE